MDMDTGTSNSSMTGMMKPYIHFTPGDILFFSNWSPTSPEAMFGTCLVLFAVALTERLMAAFGRVVEARWNQSLIVVKKSRSNGSASFTSESPLNEDKDVNPGSSSDISQCDDCTESPTSLSVQRRLAAPFIPRIELQRGARRVGSAILGYILMLSVMTFNAGFILSIVAGLGAGEVCFGRFGV